MIIPFLQFTAIQQAIPKEYIFRLPAVLIGEVATQIPITVLDGVHIAEKAAIGLSVVDYVIIIWAIGAFISLILFFQKIFRLIQLKREGHRTEMLGMQIIVLKKTDMAFSFFNTIFIGEKLSEAQKATILLHERTHVKQLHSLDLLFFELLRIVFWFNPAVYAFQNRIVLLQEYIADAKVAQKQDKQHYYQALLSQLFQTESISFINTFFNHSLIKKRIIMLQKSKSKKIVQAKYLFLLPMIAGMLFYTACTDGADVQSNETSQEYVSGGEDSEIIQRVNDLLEAVAKKGNISNEEEDALKSLNVLTSQEGVNHKDFESVQDKVAIPFGVIDKIPTYPGCEGLSQEASKKCFTNKISTFVAENFKVDNLNDSGITGRQRIVVNFTVTYEGNVVVNKIKADHPDLEAEALWTINQLPKMTPGEQDGKLVGVMYTLPIIFDMD